MECGGLPPLSRAHPAQANEGSAKNPPRGKFVRGVFYIAAKAATHKASRICTASFRELRARSRDQRGYL